MLLPGPPFALPSEFSEAVAAPRIFPGFVSRMMPICAALGLDKRRVFDKNSLLLLRFGRIAQRESVPFTRERSKVRSLVRPPFHLIYKNILSHFPKACPKRMGHNRGTRQKSLPSFLPPP
jgi:hypothetical protein